MITRAYPQLSGRQQDADRLVYSEDDMRRVLGEALTSGTVATIRLGADIVLSASLKLSGTYDVVIDGAGHAGFKSAPGGALTEFFFVPTATTAEGVTFKGCSFTAAPDTVIRVADATSSLRRVDFQDGYFDMIGTVVASNAAAPTWSDSVVDGMTFICQRGTSFISATLGSVVLKRCTVSRCNGWFADGDPFAVNVDNASGSTGNFYFGLIPRNPLLEDVYLTTTAAEENLLTQPLVVGTYPTTLAPGFTAFTTANARDGGVSWTQQGGGSTSGAVALTLSQFTPSPSKSYLVSTRIIGRRTNGADPGQTDTFTIVQQFKVSSTGAVTIGAVLSMAMTTDDPMWPVAIDTSGGFIRIRASGIIGVNINWSSNTTVDEV